MTRPSLREAVARETPLITAALSAPLIAQAVELDRWRMIEAGQTP
jgi:hypothetical protein